MYEFASRHAPLDALGTHHLIHPSKCSVDSDTSEVRIVRPFSGPEWPRGMKAFYIL
jgi:hypothetical protein